MSDTGIELTEEDEKILDKVHQSKEVLTSAEIDAIFAKGIP
jgi:hypothetical protein